MLFCVALRAEAKSSKEKMGRMEIAKSQELVDKAEEKPIQQIPAPHVAGKYI